MSETAGDRADDDGADEGPDEGLPRLHSLEELVRLVQARPGLFVRYSKGPNHDRDDNSHDYESGLELPGLSTNPLDPEEWWSRPLEDWLTRRLCQYDHLREEGGDERRPWVLEGTIVGRGPDNEPLVRLIRPVAWIEDEALAEAKRRYEERFDAGRDSIG